VTEGTLSVTSYLSYFPVFNHDGVAYFNQAVQSYDNADNDGDQLQSNAMLIMRIPTNMVVVSEVRTQVIFGDLVNSVLPLIPWAFVLVVILLFALVPNKFMAPRLRGDR